MNTITHRLRRLRCLSIALLTAAATCAFAQAPNCTASPGPNCLYVPASSHGFTAFERSVVYTDHTGVQRLVRLLVRQPLGAAGPMPVVVWSHGGAEGKQDPATSMAEWSTLSARAGYFSISIAHAPRDLASRAALCRSIGINSTGCRLFRHLDWDRPHDIRAVLDQLGRMASSELRGRIDMAKIAVGGHSAGSGAAQTLAGATRDFVQEPGRFSDPDPDPDPRPIAFLALSPQQPGGAGFFDTQFKRSGHSWADVQRPMFTATGDGDDTCEPTDMPGTCLGDTPFGRRIGFQRMPAGGNNKYQLYLHDADAFHMLFELNAAACPHKNVNAAKCAEIVRWLSSAALAFLDGHVRQWPAALLWLQSNRIELASGGVAEWQRK
jgi:hypothetical protein